MKPWRDERLRPVLAACVTLGFAVGVFAVSFGVTSVSAGASVGQTCVMSLLVFPGAMFSLTLFSLNFLGDGLRDALDVRSSKD